MKINGENCPSAKTPLVNEISAMLDRLEPLISPNSCIFRVPPRIRLVNPEAYTPEVISIGPFHHGEKHLQKSEQYKLRYLSELLKRSKMNLCCIVQAIKYKENTIRDCYSEAIQLTSDEFVKMIMIDSSFIIEHFLRNYFPHLRDELDGCMYKPWLLEGIQNDLILIENQIPFFVLNDLHKLVYSSFDSPSFLELSLQFFDLFNKQGKFSGPEPRHFNDLLRSFKLPYGSGPRPTEADKIKHVHSATELKTAGVKFKVSSSKCLLHIKFSSGVLEFPSFHVHNRTESRLRNLMAMEQCLYPYNTYICDYIFMVDCLINTEKDVDLLIDEKIVVNRLSSSHEVANLVNNLCKNVTFTEGFFYFSGVAVKLEAYYEDLWHSWHASFLRDYFGNPWLTASTIAAILLLLLTLTQTLCSVLAVFK